MNNSFQVNSVRDILGQLLKFDTTSRESNLDLMMFIKEYLETVGVDSTLIFNQEHTKANLYARLGPSGDGGVMLSGHTDVVPVDGQKWSVPPFIMTERDGKCYGRGSADMKGYIACVLAAIPHFQQSQLRMPLHLAFSYDEEVGCLGVRSLIEHIQASADKPLMCIVGEPTEMKPVFGHKGKVAMRCKVEGHACHSAYAPDGINAIEYAAKLISKATELSESLEAIKDDRFSPPFSTMQTGVIQGGSALNIVPEFCFFDIEMRYLPGMDAGVTFGSLIEYAQNTLQPKMNEKHPESNIKFESLSSYPPLLTDPQSEFAQLVASWSDNDQFETVAFGTEGGLFDELGIATVVCGPGSMAQGHKPDEFVTVEQLELCTHMLENLRQWMTES